MIRWLRWFLFGRPELTLVEHKRQAWQITGQPRQRFAGDPKRHRLSRLREIRQKRA